MHSLTARKARAACGTIPAMDALGLFWHLVDFALPAFGVGAFSAALCKLVWRRSLAGVRWSTLAWQASAAGLAVLVAGLVITRHDGRMATYAALVAVCALVPWVHTVRR